MFGARVGLASLAPLGGRLSCRHLSYGSESPIYLAFNKRPAPVSSARPPATQGLFQVPELTSAGGFDVLKQAVSQRTWELVDEACLGPDKRTRKVVSVFDELSDELCQVADLAEFVRLAHPEGKWARAAEAANIEVSRLVEQLNTHLGLYQSLNGVVARGDGAAPESDVDRHVAKLFLLDFQQNGIHLDDASRQRVVELNDYVLQVGQEFANRTQLPLTLKAQDLPQCLKKLVRTGNRGEVELSSPHFDGSTPEIRENGYRLYYNHDPQQEHLLSQLLEHRQLLAELCEYPTFGHRAMVGSLAGRPENVDRFLSQFAAKLKSKITSDHEEMLRLKRVHYKDTKGLEVWDVPYYSSQGREVLFRNLSYGRVGDSIINFFSLGACMDGLNDIFRCLYNVELVVEECDPDETWHIDVYKLQVRDLGTGRPLGYIYCDMFSRANKPALDSHFTIRGGRQVGDADDDADNYQNPVVVLMLNLPAPGWIKPSLLNPSMIENLFHEMGHAMHSMLGRTKYQHVTGTRCSTDFAEVPSTLMEYFAGDPRVLHRMSRHYSSDEKLPQFVVDKWCASRKAFTAADLQTQVLYALADHTYHCRPEGIKAASSATDTTTTDLMGQVHAQAHSLPYPVGTAWHHRFSHMVGYGSRYYSYLMARSVAASIWQQYFRADPFCPDAGAKYRHECLAHGGGKPSHELVSDYLGRAVQADDLAEALIEEIDEKQETVERAKRDSA